MTNTCQLEKIQEGPMFWNLWRSELPCDTPIDLAGVDLSGNNLCGINLSGANLAGTNFSGVNLGSANIANANLARANLTNTNLTNTILTDANLDRADLHSADLHGANLSNSSMRSTRLYGAVLINAKLIDANLVEANLTVANLTHANLTGARLADANLAGANFTGANFTDVKFRETIFADTDLTRATGLEESRHFGPSTIDHRTIERSGRLPINFLRSCGLPESLIDYLPSLLIKPISYYSCFISYSHVDKVFARRLHDQLQGRGVRCWLDEHQLLPGDDIYEQVEQGIKLWDKVLLCSSENSLTSWWVDSEIDRAFRKEQKLMEQRKKKVWSLIPLNLDGFMFSEKWDRGLAGQVKSRFAADFVGWEKDNAKFEQGFEHVLKALKTDRLGREIAPASKL